MIYKLNTKSRNYGFGTQIRRSPFFQSTIDWGAKDFSIYNHMYIPRDFGNPEENFWNLVNEAILCDVSVERQVEIKGPDAKKFVQYLTPRDIANCEVGQCKYILITDDKGGILNDPVLLKVGPDRYWLSIADSDIELWASAIAAERGLDVQVFEPDVSPLAIQGPKAEAVVAALFGDWVRSLKHFGFKQTELQGIQLILARSGWSKQGGYEVYVENRKAGQMLYDELFSVGKEFSVEPGCPNLIERIESALLSAGNDFDSGDNPYECGFDKYIDIESDINYLGKKALIEISKSGINKKLMGVLIDLDKIEVTESIPLYNNNKTVGDLRSATYSPNLKKIVGIAMVKKEYWDKKTPIELKIGDKKSKGTLCDLPIV